MGKLVVYYATMNSGKSIDLIRTAHNYEENGFRVIVMKPMLDTKGNDCVSTRIGLERKCDYLIGKTDSIQELLSGKLDGTRCIFIDEAQFLSKNQVEELYEISKCISDIAIICYSLRLNFKGEMFEGSVALFSRADSLKELKTLCFCGRIARFVGRKVNGEFVSDGSEVVIDGEHANIEYCPLCAEHFYELVKKDDLNLVRRRVYGK